MQQSWLSTSPSWPTFLAACLLIPLMSGRRDGPPPSFVFGRPQGTLEVATSPPSVTDAPSADDAAAAAATNAATVTMMVGSATTRGVGGNDEGPRFLYPPATGLEVNSLDEIEVQYETEWAALTLSVTCQGAGVGGTKSFDVALKEESGKYTLQPISDEITVSEYPIECSLLLQDGGSVANFVVGPEFKIESTGGVGSLYASATTQALSDAAAATRSGSPSTTGGSLASGTGRDGSSSTASSDNAQASETGVAGASSDSSSGSGLSAGAGAGIAIGVILLLALIGLGVFFFLRQRRRMAAMQSELEQTKKQHQSDVAYVDGLLKAAGKPETRNGGRVVMAEAPNRGSGDWKRFFNAKTVAGGGAGAAMPSSRLGTAVSPGPYSPGLKSSVAGSVHGSTVGLVSSSR